MGVEKAEAIASSIAARTYMECSALKNEGVDAIFEAATRAAMLVRTPGGTGGGGGGGSMVGSSGHPAGGSARGARGGGGGGADHARGAGHVANGRDDGRRRNEKSRQQHQQHDGYGVPATNDRPKSARCCVVA